jgi:hypothetical protein
LIEDEMDCHFWVSYRSLIDGFELVRGFFQICR